MSEENDIVDPMNLYFTTYVGASTTPISVPHPWFICDPATYICACSTCILVILCICEIRMWKAVHIPFCVMVGR